MTCCFLNIIHNWQFFPYPKYCFFLSLMPYSQITLFCLLIFCNCHFRNMVFPTNYPVLHATVCSNESHTNSHCLSLLRFAPSADSIILVAVFGAEFSSFSTRTCWRFAAICLTSAFCIPPSQWADTYYVLVVELRLHWVLFLMMLCQFPSISQ